MLKDEGSTFCFIVFMGVPHNQKREKRTEDKAIKNLGQKTAHSPR
jgi:hypothetical protein